MSIFDTAFNFVWDTAESTIELVSSGINYVAENPGKIALVCAATVATGGTASVFAGPIAALAGSTGLLGTTAAGTAISSLSGAALTNASLAAIGGGTLAAGGGGMAAGATVITATGAAVGSGIGIGTSAVIND